jgi:6-phosphogluconolactonase
MKVPSPLGQPFDSREALAKRLAADVAGWLSEAIAARGRATLAVSGGSTPKLFFQMLSNADVDWAKVTVTLVDERFVPEDSPRSNAALARSNLLRGRAAAAAFVGLYDGTQALDAAATRATARLAALDLPFDVVVLGMGTDGHTASFFPDAPNLDALTDPLGEATVETVRALSGGEPRLTLTLPVLVSARHLVLHIEGEEKRRVLESAVSGAHLPIATVMAAAGRPLDLYWAP